MPDNELSTLEDPTVGDWYWCVKCDEWGGHNVPLRPEPFKGGQPPFTAADDAFELTCPFCQSSINGKAKDISAHRWTAQDVPSK